MSLVAGKNEAPPSVRDTKWARMFFPSLHFSWISPSWSTRLMVYENTSFLFFPFFKPLSTGCVSLSNASLWAYAYGLFHHSWTYAGIHWRVGEGSSHPERGFLACLYGLWNLYTCKCNQNIWCMQNRGQKCPDGSLYFIFTQTNSLAFTKKSSCVRRRYSEFVWLRKKLQENAMLMYVTITSCYCYLLQ